MYWADKDQYTPTHKHSNETHPLQNLLTIIIINDNEFT